MRLERGPKEKEPTDKETYEGEEIEHPKPNSELESHEGNSWDPHHGDEV